MTTSQDQSELPNPAPSAEASDHRSDRIVDQPLQAIGSKALSGGLVLLAAYFAGIPFGPIGVVIAFSASGILIRLPIMFYLAGRDGPVSAADQWNSMFATLPCWFAAYGGTAAALAIADEAVQLAIPLICS